MQDFVSIQTLEQRITELVASLAQQAQVIEKLSTELQHQKEVPSPIVVCNHLLLYAIISSQVYSIGVGTCAPPQYFRRGGLTHPIITQLL